MQGKNRWPDKPKRQSQAMIPDFPWENNHVQRPLESILEYKNPWDNGNA